MRTDLFKRLTALLAIAALALCLGGCGADGGAQSGSSSQVQQPVEHSHHYTFRNNATLRDHYDRHGSEMGFATPEEYQEAACAVINDPDALHKLEAEDGDDVYYLEDTNEFVVVSPQGYIRTYFNPSDGKRYYDRQ